MIEINEFTKANINLVCVANKPLTGHMSPVHMHSCHWCINSYKYTFSALYIALTLLSQSNCYKIDNQKFSKPEHFPKDKTNSHGELTFDKNKDVCEIKNMKLSSEVLILPCQ